MRLSPEVLPYTGIMPMLIPAFLVINILLFLLYLLRGKRLLVIPLVALIIGFKFFALTFQYNTPEENPEGISVLSYNVRLFNFGMEQDEKKSLTKNSIQWVRDHPADIKCLQEFYQNYTIPTYNSIKQISDGGRYEYKYELMEGTAKRNSYGLAIFSKYPIINGGKVFQNNWTNGAIFTDINIEGDTVRIYNTHLESMNIKADDLNNIEGIKENYRDTFRKLKSGTQTRAKQVEILKDHITSSPYPVIVAGDFNDVPYSYTYFTMKSILNNAYEAAGRGFGFTYNRVLFFLRIDQLFFDNGFTAKNFNTYREVDYSDHYPISAIFQLLQPRPVATDEN
ncbi:endonuclease/exonuclease/phosphatase family protein [Anditalea andensis]|uniref:endonuclease/exonuclease/phosphatase family protein n=1 Tax=Anditalea andensis TaxID=1048983 RepID=UPI002934C023|nr:endonuclease/exonuclease/phosphatase family protein [Anditalea andensis]